MKLPLLALALPMALGLSLQEPEPYPGASSHAHPPPDYYCEHNSPTPAHDCTCHRVADPGQMCEDEPEAPECKAWCFEHAHFVENQDEPFDRHANARGHWEGSHCHCPVTCPMDGEHKQ